MTPTPLDFFNQNNIIGAVKAFESDVERYLHDEATIRAVMFIYSSTAHNDRIDALLRLLPVEIKELIKDIEVEHLVSQGRKEEALILLSDLSSQQSVRTIDVLFKTAPEFLSVDHLRYLKKIVLKPVAKEEKLLAKFLIAQISQLFSNQDRPALFDQANDYAFRNRKFTEPSLSKVINHLSRDSYRDFGANPIAKVGYRILIIVGPSTSGKTFLQNSILSPSEKKNYDESLHLLSALNDNFPEYEHGTHGLEFSLLRIKNLKIQLDQELKLSAERWNIFTLPNNLTWLPVIERVFSKSFFLMPKFSNSVVENRIYRRYYSLGSKELFDKDYIKAYVHDYLRLTELIREKFHVTIVCSDDIKDINRRVSIIDAN